jgi:hypothetical protein
MPSDKKFIVKNMILSEDDLKIEKTYLPTKEKWILKYPLPEQQRRIARLTAGEFGGLPIDSYLATDRDIIIRDVELNELVEGPDSWEGVDSCLDEDLKNWLYEELQKFKREVQGKLKKNKFAKRMSKGEVSS